MPVHLLQAMPMLVLGLIALAWIIVRWVMLRRVGSRAGAVAHRELWVGLAVRRAVVEQLGSGSASISELAARFGISLPGMKKHVLALEEAGLAITQKGCVSAVARSRPTPSKASRRGCSDSSAVQGSSNERKEADE